MYNRMLSGIPAPSHFSEKLLTSLRQSSNDTPRPTPWSRVFSWGKVLTLAGIKHFEMPEECHQYKGRIVYRGDRITDQSGQTVSNHRKKNHCNNANCQFLRSTWHYGFGAMTTKCHGATTVFVRIPAMWVQPYLAWEVWLPEWPAKYDRNVKLTSYVWWSHFMYTHKVVKDGKNIWRNKF